MKWDRSSAEIQGDFEEAKNGLRAAATMYHAGHNNSQLVIQRLFVAVSTIISAVKVTARRVVKPRLKELFRTP